MSDRRTDCPTDDDDEGESWFVNHYRCYRCGNEWSDEWSCMCDDDCPACGARHCSPYDSDDA
jgi:hypothetical protein